MDTELKEMTPFEEWYHKEFFFDGDFEEGFRFNDLKEAYEAGWNACRDKWGGLEYNDPFNGPQYEYDGKMDAD